MKKLIGIISTLIGLYGFGALSAQVLMSDWFENGRRGLYLPVDFRQGIFNFFDYLGFGVNCVFYLMLLMGSLIYLRSGKDNSGLLRFGLSIVFYSAIIQILWFLYYTYPWFKQKSPDDPIGFYGVWGLFPVLLFFFSFFIIKRLSLDFRPMDESDASSSPDLPALPAASKGIRLLHFVLDFFIAISLTSPFMLIFGDWIDRMHFRNRDLYQFFLMLIFGFHRFLYYGMMECLFKVTPVKYLTSSRVIREHGPGLPSVNNFMVRTCCRFIPFDSVSFLGSSGWHDSLSQTSVVIDNNFRPGKAYITFWIILAIVISVALSLI
jgi:hypothetical protein